MASLTRSCAGLALAVASFGCSTTSGGGGGGAPPGGGGSTSVVTSGSTGSLSPAGTTSTGTGGSPSTAATGGNGGATATSSGSGGSPSTATTGGAGGATASSSGSGGGDGGTGGCATAADCPASTTSCAAPACTGGVCGWVFVANGTACSDHGGNVCEAGACVTCTSAAQCTSGVCTAGVCQAPTCTDGVKNGTETGVDCGGGTCPTCLSGQTCVVDTDCTSQTCTSGVCTGECFDGIQDGNETGVDCGGSCQPCATGEGCLVDADCHMCEEASPTYCVPSRCVNGTCGAQALYEGACVTEWVVDATRLYWTCTASGTVLAAPKDGSGPVTTLASGQAGPNGIAVDATQLYWGNSGDGTVMATPLAASGLTTLASGLSGLGLLHVAGGQVWAMAGSSLAQIPVGGGPAIPAWTGTTLVGVAVDASNVYWSTQATWAAYFNQYVAGLVYAMPLTGGPPTVILTGDYGGVGQWDRLVPWGGGVAAIELGQWDGFEQDEYVETYEQGSPGGDSDEVQDGATDGVNLYYTGTWCFGAVVKSTAGGVSFCASRNPLIDLPGTRLAVDDTYVYLWANGTIYRTFK